MRGATSDPLGERRQPCSRHEIANDVPEGAHVLQTFGYERWLGPSGHIYVLKRIHVK
jgi:hypothetical protein